MRVSAETNGQRSQGHALRMFRCHAWACRGVVCPAWPWLALPCVAFCALGSRWAGWAWRAWTLAAGPPTEPGLRRTCRLAAECGRCCVHKSLHSRLCSCPAALCPPLTQLQRSWHKTTLGSLLLPASKLRRPRFDASGSGESASCAEFCDTASAALFSHGSSSCVGAPRPCQDTRPHGYMAASCQTTFGCCGGSRICQAGVCSCTTSATTS